MEQKESFFVTAKGEIQPIPADEQTHYFEILASYDEKKQLEHIIYEMKANSKQEWLDIWSPKKHFNEAYAEHDRGKDSKLSYELFRFLYLLGTEKTKRDIEEMNVLPELYEQSHDTIEKVK
ncbi:hypothetical protein [Fictibacillus phosphorivorans]|uniref:hypothetical protein n=1 Tax=Fictibacillus phosphorivorans TaxID=1221500 RepID=UPI00203BA7D4|nr:hypothetical protein [Fictibacillus phosphorivorans]MCM3719251.1 hypothetical protein [Fictibacillus phosphorivorans]MCM3776873.1 hypothetical protein [Fictibacillus phosphorivorans]